jgi:hypothetical protein
MKEISIDGKKVSLDGIEEIFKEIKSLNLEDEESLKNKLIEEIKKKNYVPDIAIEKYKTALFREYKIFFGEYVENEQKNLEIKILGIGCLNCLKLEQETVNACAELNISADIQHIYDINEFAKYGVFGGPALVINSKVKSVGRVPHREQIKRYITEEINEKL